MKGSVYRRGDRWEFRFDLPSDPLTGKRRYSTRSGFRTRKEADAALRDAIKASESGRHVAKSHQTVSQYLDEWLPAVSGRVKPTTWSSYRDYADAYVRPVIGDTKLQDLTARRLNLLYTYLLERGRVRTVAGGSPGLAPKTVRNVHVMLHRALRDAVRWSYLPNNPAELAEPPAARGSKPRVWTSEQLRTFIEYTENDRFHALWMLAVTTGLRRGELAGLREQDLDLRAGYVTPAAPRVVVDGRAAVSTPKTSSGYRRLALDPRTVDALRAHLKQWRAESRAVGSVHVYLFCWPDGSEVHPQTITDRFFRLSREAGLPHIRLHDVRHSYATAALRAGVHPKVISERLGHASMSFTLQTYSHVLQGMDAAAASLVADHILDWRA